MQRRLDRWLPIAAVALLAVVVVVTALSSGPDQAARSPTPATSALPSADSSPVGSPSATPEASPSPSAAASAPEVHANALGTLTGNWLFVGKLVPNPQLVGAEVQIWAVPLDGGAPKLAFGYEVATGGAPEGIFDNTPYLRRQFSPDGTRMVVSVGGRLVVVDLASGQARRLGVSGYFPAWSKDGSQIAFLFEKPVKDVVPPEDAIGVISSSGGPIREVAVVGYLRQSVEWSPDGSMLLLVQPDGLAIVESASGRIVRRISAVSPASQPFAHWRSGRPQIAVATSGCEEATTKLIGFDDATAPERTLLDSGERCAIHVRDPRWNPAAVNDLLYIAARVSQRSEPNDYRAHVLDVGSGRDTTLPVVAYEATWTWDGSEIAYVAKAPSGPYGDSVRLWRRGGGGERELLKATGRDLFFSLASLKY